MLREFEVNNLGKFRFVSSVLFVDYPRTFVAKRLDDSSRDADLYLFDEIKVDENSIQFACVRITFDEYDKLSLGLKTIQQCFKGAYGISKQGFIVTSSSLINSIFAEKINAFSDAFLSGETFPDKFLDNLHGAGALSAVYEKNIFSIVVNEEEFVDPMLSSSTISDDSLKAKSLLNSFPYFINTRTSKMCYSFDHSVVLNFIVDDKNNNEDLKIDNLEARTESDEMMKALSVVFDDKSSNEQIIEACKGKVDSLEKCNDFISTFASKRNRKGFKINLVNSSKQESKTFDFSISNTNYIFERNKKCILHIKEILSNSQQVTLCGKFLMYDATSKNSFKFKTIDGTVIRGFSSVNLDDSNDEIIINKRRYYATFNVSNYQGEFGSSKPIYQLTSFKLFKEPEEEVLNL